MDSKQKRRHGVRPHGTVLIEITRRAGGIHPDASASRFTHTPSRALQNSASPECRRAANQRQGQEWASRPARPKRKGLFSKRDRVLDCIDDDRQRLLGQKPAYRTAIALARLRSGFLSARLLLAAGAGTAVTAGRMHATVAATGVSRWAMVVEPGAGHRNSQVIGNQYQSCEFPKHRNPTIARNQRKTIASASLASLRRGRGCRQYTVKNSRLSEWRQAESAFKQTSQPEPPQHKESAGKHW